MPKAFAVAYPLALLLVATLLEVSGDAAVRMAIYQHTGAVHLGLFACGAALLLGDGSPQPGTDQFQSGCRTLYRDLVRLSGRAVPQGSTTSNTLSAAPH
jgi:hypothetical protein